MRRAIAILTVLVVFGWTAESARVSAECITDGGGPKKRLGGYPLVFVAEVLGFEKSNQPESLNYRVRFRVIEAFRGINSGERVLEFQSSAESFRFAVSQRVLVYAHGTAGNYSTHCTATRIVTLDDSEVKELRRLSRRSLR